MIGVLGACMVQYWSTERLRGSSLVLEMVHSMVWS
jgi:hypothetical protein